MNKYSISEVMEMAVQTERLGYQFYTTMAEKFKKDDGLVKLFSTLAEKEKAHERAFTRLKDAVMEQAAEPAGWSDVSDYLRAFVESEFFLGRGKSLPSMERIKTIRDAVHFALGFEKETLLYYMELLPIVREKAPLETLISEEKSHVVWLERFKTGLPKQ